MAVAGAIIGSAIIGGYSSKKAASTQAKATEKGMAQSSALADQSRAKAYELYAKAGQSQRQGLTSAFDFYKKNTAAKYTPFQQGNVAAQKAIMQGAGQAQNAILGLPFNLNAIQPQQINADTSFIQQAQLPPQVVQEMGPQQTGVTPAAYPQIQPSARGLMTGVMNQ